ncbi:hypothetical protein PHJA_002572300 [Phtheirospermum japonicum]|uniref:Uncharacterized protein n=1 Tax=Phtheirospermum japonicum TaxID=374723 RepID=A0A830D7Q3_9LAMI|nr:hypothetical protein PHJA_002572300 [Phtheirospermum japonicum]
MSRCFPFPPPGYERKHRPEDLDLLKEAKSKEKKHKKEKKDKERKKDKEKEKDGSAEKHRDKKDRKEKEKHKDKKEKHRDKKDNKEDRGKDKEKSSISEESSVSRNAEISEPKLYPATNSKDRSNFPNEVKCSALLQDPKNGGKPSQNEESKFVQELDRRIKDEKIRGSQLPDRVAVAAKKDQERGDNKNNRVDKNMDPQGLKNELSGNTVAQNLIMPAVKSKGEGMIPRPVSEENGRRLEDKEKCKETVVGVKRGDKEKDKGRGKDKDKEKEEKRKKKKDEKAKLKSENDGSRKNNLGGFAVNKSTDILKVDDGNAVNEGNIKKRKDMGTNGFLHDQCGLLTENEIRPNKIQKPPPPLQSIENGRKLEPFPTPPKPFNDKQTVPKTVRVDNKDQSIINGTLEAPKPSPFKPNPPPPPAATRDSNDFKRAAVSKMEDLVFAESSRRSPHPDSKYLAEVLTVPENMSDWFDNDEQDWLFSKKVQSKAKLVPAGEDVRVWSEAVHIESADVCALPYVIPY